MIPVNYSWLDSRGNYDVDSSPSTMILIIYVMLAITPYALIGLLLFCGR